MPLIFCSFVIFKLVESQHIFDGGRLSIANQHHTNIISNVEIDCFILGGSNSFFSLSAEQISNNTEFNCYNLSLLNEGYSFYAYWDFIKSLPFNKENIKHIFYGSITPIQDDKYYYSKVKNAELGIGIQGDQTFRLLGRSIASYLNNFFKGKDFFEEKISYPLPNKYGDFDFSKFKDCEYSSSSNTFDSIYWQDINLLSGWVNSQLDEMKSIFPKANLYFLVPPVLFKEKTSNFDNKTVKIVESTVLNFDNSPNKTMFIFEPAYNDVSVICDAPHHANAIGRKIRTRNLISNF
jgi:hypothetical protein